MNRALKFQQLNNLSFIKRFKQLSRVLTFVAGIFLFAACQSITGKTGQGSSQDSLTHSHTSPVQGKMAIDCAICKEPSRAGLLMAGMGRDSGVAGAAAMTTEKEDASINNRDTAKMIFIKGGSFKMGSNQFPDAEPIHEVTVSGYYMDAHEVTNDQFAKFVQQTHYVTVAERPLNPKDYPGVPLDKLVPGSGVFTPPAHQVNLDNPMQWWTYVPGANWRHPKGPGSDLKGKGNLPVVQVCYDDCLAYANWAGKRIPTEAQWEYAAKAGQNYPNYYWGKELAPGGHYMANIFQGNFPYRNTLKDGFGELAPIGQFPANAFGLFDMEGNAWEWCSDFYRPDYYKNSPATNPKGPADSYDPQEPGVIKRVQRGGSFLCSDDYCIRYKAGARGKGEPTSGSNNLGFRLVR